MSCIRPATPGFLVTLLAAVLLAVVSFSVPYFKSVFFLKASLQDQGISGSITFGTLGYCLQLSNGTTCSKPSVGYELNINALVGNDLPIQIPNVVVKWLTYALVLHIVALGFAAVSAVFGLLAHVREMSMSCFSTCISGAGAAIALLAFIFDLVFFFVAKSRINAVKGGSASMGTAIWLTLAAWLCLFFAGCFFGLGRCCIRRRSRESERVRDGRLAEEMHTDQLRMEAVMAEAERKARQNKTGMMDDEIYIDEGDKVVAYRPVDSTSPANAGVGAGNTAYSRQNAVPSGPRQQQSPYAGGYAQAPPGTRAVDDYYNNAAARRQPSTNTYPPRPTPGQSPAPQQQQQQPYPRRQASARTQASGYAPQPQYNLPPGAAASPAMPPIPSAATAAYDPYGQNQYGTTAAVAGQQNYAHSRANTYANASAHTQYPSAYSNQYAEPEFNADTYNSTAYMQPSLAAAAATPYHSPTSYSPPAGTVPYNTRTSPPPASHTPHRQASQQQSLHGVDRSYTLGGGGYGASTVPALPEHGQSDAAYYDSLAPPAHHAQYSSGTTESHMPSPYSPLPSPQPSHVTYHGQQQPSQQQAGPSSMLEEQPVYEDSPPMYDDATAQPPGEWNTKARAS